MRKKKILVVDDEENIRTTLSDILSDEGYSVIIAENGESALRMIQSEAPDLALLDIWMPGIDGIQTLALLKNIDPDIEVLMMSGHGAIDTAVKATKFGAFDFIEKPFTIDRLLKTVAKAIKTRKSRLARRKADSFAPGSHADRRFIGSSRLTRKLKRTIKSAAEANCAILIQGEEGLGKKHAARMIHTISERRAQPFVVVTCEELTQKEFSALLEGDNSRISQAESGTIFLEYIDRLKPSQQVKLANLLKPYILPSNSNGKRGRAGKGVRVVASAEDISPDTFNKKLLTLFEENGQVIHVAPLRKRKADIPDFVERFAEEAADTLGKHLETIDEAVFDTMAELPWPGNLNELQETVIKAVEGCDKDHLSLTNFESLVFDATERKNRPVVKEKKRGQKSGALKQKTLKSSKVLSGQGLHSGINTGLILSPLPPGSGVVFADITTGARLNATIDNVRSTNYATTLSNGDVTIATVEHILSALSSYGITNVLIKIGDEAPIMDGSARDFCELIEDAGVEEQGAPLDEIILKETIMVSDPETGATLTAKPAKRFSATCRLEYPQPIGSQECHYTFKSPESYKETIAPARTFGFLNDIKALNEAGLASGGSLANVILIGEGKVLNTPLRFPDEPARHKILDLIGDLYLLGRPIKAKFIANQSGHTQNIEMVKRIVAMENAANNNKRYAAS